MLTGLIEPSSGKAEVMGIDIFQNMDEFRKILGVCP
jgi:ABC-type multidrug transport system ATPase subunit